MLNKYWINFIWIFIVNLPLYVQSNIPRYQFGEVFLIWRNVPEYARMGIARVGNVRVGIVQYPSKCNCWAFCVHKVMNPKLGEWVTRCDRMISGTYNHRYWIRVLMRAYYCMVILHHLLPYLVHIDWDICLDPSGQWNTTMISNDAQQFVCIRIGYQYTETLVLTLIALNMHRPLIYVGLMNMNVCIYVCCNVGRTK